MFKVDQTTNISMNAKKLCKVPSRGIYHSEKTLPTIPNLETNINSKVEVQRIKEVYSPDIGNKTIYRKLLLYVNKQAEKSSKFF
jgi:hypothetical protein